MNTNEEKESSLAGGSNSLQRPAYLADFLEISFDAIVAFNSQKRITFWNPAAEQMYGWMAHEALGKTPTELFWPVRTPQEQEDIKQGQLKLERGETIQGEYQPCRADGSFFWVEYSARGILDKAGAISGYVVVYRDITQRKYVENEIRLVSKMPAENPNPVMRLTRDGKILYANDASAPLLESWKRQLDKTIPKEFQQPVAEAFASGLKREIEIEHAGKNFSFILVPIREAGYVNCYGSEVTERKRIEQQALADGSLLPGPGISQVRCQDPGCVRGR
jgi:PAS domain S-box-containing protein